MTTPEVVTFEVGGINYGPNDYVWLRQDLINERDKALKQNDFSASVVLSHTIGLLHMMAKHIWSIE
jgi:hypothetical protein